MKPHLSKQAMRWRCLGIRELGWVFGIATVLGCQPSDTPAPSSSDSTAPTPTVAEAPQDMRGSSSNVDLSYPERFEQAVKELDSGRIDEAWGMVKQLVISRPSDPDLMFLTARVMAARKDLPGALQQLDRISRDSPQWGPAAGQAAEWLVDEGELEPAERKLVEVVKEYPTAVPALRLLARIYNTQGRRWEASRYLDRLVRLGDFTTKELMSTVDYREFFGDEKTYSAFLARHPDDPYVRFSAIRAKLLKNSYGTFLDELQEMSRLHPHLREPWVWTATSMMELERWEDLVEWLQTPVKGADKHPEYWYALGGLMRHENRFPEAARAFSECIRLDRRHVAGHQALADTLLDLDRVEEAQRVRKFANSLTSINDYVQQISYNYGEPKLYSVIADLYAEMNDEVGAFGWAATGAMLGHLPMTDALKDQQQALGKGRSSPPRSLEGLPIDQWPLPQLPSHTSTEPTETRITGDDSISPIRMRDVAQFMGIDGTYHNGSKPNRSWYTIEGVGGGVNVLDYDRDGWPDLAFSQAGDSPIESNPRHLPKTFYRSINGASFREVSHIAGLADFGYGQGLGVSDLDQDGFADILVANLGESRIYRNCGDGTFEYLVVPQSDPMSIWNSSIRAADLNGDGLPDLLCGSYIYGKEAITRWCEVRNSNAGSCNPKMFPPGKNRILFSSGDWRWDEVDPETLESIQRGYTFGTLVTNLDGRNRNDVFFANDVSPNALLLSQSDSSGSHGLVEMAASAGVAVDSIGRAQACMGIACGDQNRDGTLDLIVTNFYNEVSTLYLQTSVPGVFVDGTRRSKLGIPTLDQLSFGCQLTDLDNDGWLDFIAVNGHIDDLRAENIPLQMPTQVLHNQKGQFRWLRDPSPGPYFDGKYVGRGLQFLDYNRDGLLDLVATHIDRPAALLENQSRSDHRWIQLELIGTRSEREAIGAIVQVQCGEETWLTGMHDGEGFFGSNERLIHLGIGNASSVDLLRIQWPSGLVEEYRNLEVNRRYCASEQLDLVPESLRQ
jgi:predicted Zn-dependent protease